MLRTFDTDQQLNELLTAVLACEVSNDEFTHREHLAMASSIIFEQPETALDRIRQAILALNKANKVEQTTTGGYHETLTVAWHRLIAAHIASLPHETPRLIAVNSVIRSLGDKRAVLKYYTKDTIMSWAARKQFVEPDLVPFPEAGR